MVAVLAVILVAGGAGLSFRTHLCHDRISGITFYPELGFQKPATCGCKEDGITGSNKPWASSRLQLKKNGCCENISIFNKLNIESQANYLLSLVPVQHAQLAFIPGSNFLVSSEVKTILQLAAESRPPPPLSGRKLVLFLSQQRIPLIS